jgi:hypothetical protein
MAKKTVLAKKKRGPPPTGKGTQIVVRMQPAPLEALDDWASQQADGPTRAEAIRRLVEIGLSTSRKVHKVDPRILEKVVRSIGKKTEG